MEYELEPVYAIKDEDGTLWNAKTNSWDSSICDGVLFTDKDDAQAELDKYLADNFTDAYVVEIGETGSTEQGDPVEVSEEEADMLEDAKCRDNPAELIIWFIEYHDQYDGDRKAEDRLMRAYVNGWKEKPEEPKKYVVFVPGTNQSYDYRKFAPGSIFPTAYISSKVPASELFTQEEIDAAGLSDCEKKEAKDNGNEHN